MSNIETALVAKEAQRKFAKGEITQAEMAAAQRAYDIERTRPEREAQQAAWKAASERQNAVWDSIHKADHAAIRQMAIDADCIREVTVKSGPFNFYDAPCKFYVPPTSHWANWHDDDAVRHHGVTSIKSLCDRFAALSDEPWDGTYGHLWSFEGQVGEQD